jgi:hypothetical protein
VDIVRLPSIGTHVRSSFRTSIHSPRPVLRC